MIELDEPELVRRCREGDQSAFRELVDAYKNLVFGLISRAIPDRSRAEDLAQEVFLRIHRGLPYFRGDARLSTWIFRIVSNLCAEESARAGVAIASLDDQADRSPAGEMQSALSIRDRTFTDLEVRDRLEKALARLPVEDRLLIAGHYLHERRYETLAEMLGMPLGTVKTRLYRAKRALRHLLESDLR
jgi:RNA polymerase sigma-70 factor (ECF subfamily)